MLYLEPVVSKRQHDTHREKRKSTEAITVSPTQFLKGHRTCQSFHNRQDVQMKMGGIHDWSFKHAYQNQIKLFFLLTRHTSQTLQDIYRAKR